MQSILSLNISSVINIIINASYNLHYY